MGFAARIARGGKIGTGRFSVFGVRFSEEDGRRAMLARYKIYRGKRPAEDPLPDGLRKDTRKHTRHCLRPSAEAVAAYLADPTEEAWEEFSRSYLSALEERFAEDRAPFDELASAATEGDVYIGCNCPTQTNPDVDRCHTVLALQFMEERYGELEVCWPEK